MVTISGIKFKTTGKRLTPPRSEVVLNYLKAVKQGKSLVEKINKDHKVQR